MLTVNYVGERDVAIRKGLQTPPGPGEVQIAVAYTGLCGTDLHILQGHMDGRVRRPLVLGHEMSGTVAEVGPEVDGWSVGDPVTVMPLTWDMTCPACQAGNFHVCQNLELIGIDSPGSLQERLNVPDRTLLALPPELRLDHAALTEPTAVAVHDVSRGQVQAGERVVVIGGGPIGVLIASVVRDVGAEVTVIEIDPQRRTTIGNLGFRTLDPRNTDQAEAIQDWTHGAGADVVFEVSGAGAAVLASTELVKVRGGIVVVAIHPVPREVDLHAVFRRELTIIGARVYQRSDFEAAVDLLRRGAIPADALITKVVPLTETSAAFTELAAGRAMKILVQSSFES